MLSASAGPARVRRPTGSPRRASLPDRPTRETAPTTAPPTCASPSAPCGSTCPCSRGRATRRRSF
eukprot:8448210-Pyramimonas_sp.AAC.1